MGYLGRKPPARPRRSGSSEVTPYEVRYRPSHLLWQTIGRFGPIGRVDAEARSMSMVRTGGTPPVGGEWTGRWFGNPLVVRAQAVGRSRVRLYVCWTRPRDGKLLFALKRVAGDSVELSTARGRAELSTARGRAELSTARGRAELSTARGHAELSTARGRAELWIRNGSASACAWVIAEASPILLEGDRIRGSDTDIVLVIKAARTKHPLRDYLRWLSSLIHKLDNTPIGQLILERVRTSPQAYLREDLCQAYLSEYGTQPHALDLRDLGTTDPSWNVQLTVRTSGLTAHGRAFAASEFALSSSVPDPVRTRALHILSEAAKFEPTLYETTKKTLNTMLSPKEKLSLRTAAISASTQLGPPAAAILAPYISDENPYVRLEITQSLAAIPSSDTEQLLLDLLRTSLACAHERIELDIATAAIQALALHGTPKSYAALAAEIEGSGFHAPLNEPAIETMRAIRQRHPQGTPGQLALSTQGELSTSSEVK